MPKLPRFKSEEEEAKFWDTHSVADYWDEFEVLKKPLTVSGPLKKKIEQRRKKRLLALRLEQRQIDAARAIALRKSLPYQTLLRMWIMEGINRELTSLLPSYYKLRKHRVGR